MARSISLASLPLLLALAGCATAPPPAPPPAPRLVSADPAEVQARLQPALAALGLAARPVSAPGEQAIRLAASGSGQAAWADCPLVTFRNSEHHVDLVRPRATSMTVEVAIRPMPSGSEVEVTARPEGSYLNHFTNYNRSSPCSSTGVLEQQLLDAAGRGP